MGLAQGASGGEGTLGSGIEEPVESEKLREGEGRLGEGHSPCKGPEKKLWSRDSVEPSWSGIENVLEDWVGV